MIGPMTAPLTPPRPTLIADAAIGLIADAGLRGLTHRAVDDASGLPAGSTSNLARTRAALLELVLVRILERETADYPAFAEGGGLSATTLPPRDLLVEVGAEALFQALTVYDRLGARFTRFTADLLAASGSTDPEADARRLIRWCDGVLFNATAGSGHWQVPMPEELRVDLDRYLAALLDEER